jgi:hypothetical protein
MAIKKYLCLASYSLYLFFERKELIEVPLKKIVQDSSPTHHGSTAKKYEQPSLFFVPTQL